MGERARWWYDLVRVTIPLEHDRAERMFRLQGRAFLVVAPVFLFAGAVLLMQRGAAPWAFEAAFICWLLAIVYPIVRFTQFRYWRDHWMANFDAGKGDESGA